MRGIRRVERCKLEVIPGVGRHCSPLFTPVGVPRRQLPAVDPWVPVLVVNVGLQHFPQLQLWEGGSVLLGLVQVRL